MRTIYPVYVAPGSPLSVAGVPAVPLSVSPALAARLIRSGAFAEKPSGGPDIAPAELPAEPAGLDFYDPPVAHGAHYLHPERINADRLSPEARAELSRVLAAREATPKGPADAGPSDSVDKE